MKQLKCLKEKMQSSIDYQLFFNCFRHGIALYSHLIYVQSALEKKDFHFNVGKQKIFNDSSRSFANHRNTADNQTCAFSKNLNVI